MSGRVEKANASRKVSCKKRSKIKAYKIQREKKHNKYTIFIINLSIIISLSNITIAITVELHWLELGRLEHHVWVELTFWTRQNPHSVYLYMPALARTTMAWMLKPQDWSLECIFYVKYHW